MPDLPIYPLRFDPIFQYRLWGSRRLADWIDQPLPDGPIGEVWLLSDRKDNPSRVSEGPLKGQTLAELIERSPDYLLGKLAPRFQRFPLLLKFLDVSAMLSVQVHPSDALPISSRQVRAEKPKAGSCSKLSLLRAFMPG
jgi:mannose-6-phosphate isomerase